MEDMIIERYKYFKNNWSATLTNGAFAMEFIFTIITLLSTMLIFSKFFQFLEMRKGIQINDPVLESFQAIDLTHSIFVMIYGALAWALISLHASPYRLMILFQSYALMIMARMVTLFILPLAPPAGMIFLQDPLVEFLGTTSTIGNDLFFSGHTATMFLLYLSVPKKLKIPFLVMTILIAVSVLLQKAHYTVDVLIAPCISFITYYFIEKSFKYRYNIKSDEF